MSLILDGNTATVTANSIIFRGNTSGTITLTANAVADTTNISLPGVTGTLQTTSNTANVVTTAPMITPTQITTDTDDWAPTGYSNAKVINANTSDVWSLGGLTYGIVNSVIINNIGSNTFLLNHEANTSTAANRFWLDEDQLTVHANVSVFLLYDLTVSRWMANGGERKVGKGFFSGGTTGSVSLVADRTTYATETTAAVSGANLSAARSHLAAAGNAFKGFFSGGSTGTDSAVANRTTYDTETTVAVSGANLSVARDGPSATGNAFKGFFSGGHTSAVSAVADRTTYATEVTAAVSGANLSAARQGLAAAGDASKGFFSGGDTGSQSAVADRTTYATEVTAAVSGANLSVARSFLDAAGTGIF
jgi:hypothetical protein